MLLSRKALILYAVLAILVFLSFSPFGEIRISRLLARLSQELIIQEVNPVREGQGFLALEFDEKLNQAAQLKAEDMIARDYFSHQGPDGEPPWSWLDKVEYHYVTAGENLAMDVNDPKVLITAWLSSPSHAKNILNENFADIGIGIAKGEINKRETIVVVMFLAKEMNLVEEITQEEEPQVLGVLLEEIKNIPPEEPLIIEVIKQDKPFFEQAGQNLVISQVTEGSNLNKTNFQVIRRFPEISRLVLSILYSILIFLAVFIIILRKERDPGLIFNSLILLVLMYLMHLPDFF
jgi:uncharacterized protein YkwD